MPAGRSRLYDILNQAVPYAPESEGEVKARLAQHEPQSGPTTEESQPGAAEEPAAPEAGEAETPGNPAWEPTPAKERSGEIDALRDLGKLIGEIGALLTELTQVAEAAPAEPGHAAPDAATDSSGTVEVTVGGDGLLSEFRLRSGWRERLPEESFDSAALEAISNAVLQATNSYYVSQWRAAPDLQRPPDSVTFGSPAPFPAGDPDAALRQVSLLIGESIRELESLERATAHRSPTEIEIRSAKSVVTLSVLDGAVTAVHTNGNWLARADTRRVCEEFMSTFDALNEAIVSAWRTGPGATGEGELGGAFSELRRMIQGMGFPG